MCKDTGLQRGEWGRRRCRAELSVRFKSNRHESKGAGGSRQRIGAKRAEGTKSERRGLQAESYRAEVRAEGRVQRG
jgi:uncharacterized protein YdaU (DUF1376 family)